MAAAAEVSKQQRQRDLAGNQNIMSAFPPRASGGPPRAGLHELGDLRAGRLESRSKSEEHAGNKGDSDGEMPARAD